LTLYIDNCKLLRQVAPPDVGLTLKLKLFSLVTLLARRLTLRPLNGVTGLPCYRLPSCANLSSLSASFWIYGHVRDRRTDGQTTAVNALCRTSWGGGIISDCYTTYNVSQNNKPLLGMLVLGI